MTRENSLKNFDENFAIILGAYELKLVCRWAA